MNLRLVSAAIGLVVLATLLGAGAYESVVVAPNFRGAPTSLEHARGFYHATKRLSKNAALVAEASKQIRTISHLLQR
jgi:hypothetical protein